MIMEPTVSRPMRYLNRSLRFFFILVLLLTSSVSVFAQTGLPAGITKRAETGKALQGLTARVDFELLLKTLENPAEREKLIRQLRALLEQRRSAQETEKKALLGQGITFVEIYEQVVGEIDSTLRRATTEIRTLPEAFSAGLKKLRDKESVRKLVDLAWKLAAAFGVAIFLGWMTLKHTRRAADRLDLPNGAPSSRKLTSSLGVSVLSLIPPVVMLAAVFLVLTVFQPSTRGTAIVLTAVWAYFIRKMILAVFRMFLAAHRPNLRFLPLRDETAAYWNVWIGRLSGVGVFGYYIVEITGIMGASPGTKDAWFDLFGALVVIQLIVLFLQQRKELAARMEARETSKGSRFQSLRITGRFLIAYWHWFAIAYLMVGYGLLLLDHPSALALMFQSTISTIVLLALFFAFRQGLRALLNRLFRVPDRFKARFPTLEGRVNRYVRIAHRIVFGILYILTILLILEAWQLRLIDFLLSDIGRFLIERIVAIAVTIGIACIAMEGGDFAAEALLQPRRDPGGTLSEPFSRAKTLIPLGRATLKVAVFSIAALIVMGRLGINITPILAGVGVLGLAVGFGAQSLIKDILSGLFNLVEDSMAVGDIVILKGTAGIVENVNLRTVRIRDLAGNVHVIPHSSVDRITNMTKDFSRYVLDVGVAYREDTDQVVAILREIDEEMRAEPDYADDILEPIDIMGVDRFEDSAVIVRARLITRPIKQWRVGREFNRRMKKVFDERGIEIPFPHRTLYFGEPKEGPPPPLYLEQIARSFERQREEK